MTQSIAQEMINVASSIEEPPQDEAGDQAPTVDTEIPAANLDIEAAMALPETEVSTFLRGAIGLIKDQPEQQLKYLQNKGFDATRDKEGNIIIQDENGRSQRFDPEGFDFGDVAEFLPEIFEGVASTIGTGVKVMGALGAPATGGASLLATGGLSGAISGAAELGTQALGKGLGVREEFNLAEVGKKAAIGAAVPPLITGLGKVIGSGIRSTGKAIFRGSVPEAIDKAGVEAAQELVGGRATPGMLTTDPGIRKTESLLSKQTLGLGGSFLRKQLDVNFAAANAQAKNLLKGKTGRTSTEVGDAFKTKLVDDLAKKLKPAEDLYTEVGKVTGAIKADLTSVKSAINKLEGRFKFSDQGIAFLGKVKGRLDEIRSVDDLKLFRTNLMDEVPPDAVKNMKIIADDLYGALTKSRKDSFVKGVRDLKGRFKPAAMTKLIDKIDEADEIYSETARLVQKSILAQGKTIKKGVKRTAKEGVEGIKSEKIVSTFLSGSDSARSKAVEQLTKSGFDDLAAGKIAEIAEKATSTAQGSFGQVNPQLVAKEIVNMSPEVAKQIFGEHGVKMAKALQKVYTALPKDINPSGTATTLDLMLLPLRQISSVGISAINIFLRSKEPVAKTALFLSLTKGFETDSKPNKSGK